MTNLLGNVGLLSRMGLTSNLLDIARPLPDIGTIMVPCLDQGELSSSALSGGNADKFRKIATGLFEEAGEIAEAQQRWGLGDPYALTATEGAWFIFDLDEGRDARRQLCFKSLKGRIFALNRYEDGRLDIETGIFRGAQASMRQKVSLSPRNEVSTAGYSLEFYEGGAVGLAAYFGLSKPMSATVALALGQKIVDSGQYLQLSGRKLDKKNLRRNDGAYELAMRTDPDADEPSVRLSFKGNCRHGHLILDLARPESASPLMPLVPGLLEIWEGAMHHLYAYPY